MKFNTIIPIIFLLAQSLCLDQSNRPNVVMIMADDMGYSDIGYAMAVKSPLRPYLDALAADGGLRFSPSFTTLDGAAPLGQVC